MPRQRRDERPSARFGQPVEGAVLAGGPAQAAEALRALRNRIAHFSVSDPADSTRTAYLEFDLPMSEPIITIFSIILASEQERYAKLKELHDQISPEPGEKVLAALRELEEAGPWFTTKEELFRALEAQGEE